MRRLTTCGCAALNLALDKEIIAGKVLGYGQQPARPLPQRGRAAIACSPARRPAGRRNNGTPAKQLLAQAGFNAENPLRFTVLYSNDATIKKIVIAAAAMWKKNLG